jgi:cbb3-type cytochrome oxidase subunit 1
MHAIPRNFFTLAIGYGIVGMTVGLSMAISHDHTQTPTHAHMMVLGWVMSSVFAFFYQLVPAARESRLAPIHFWLTAISGVTLVGGLYFLMGGNTSIEPVVAVASICFFLAMILFAFIALPVIWRVENRAQAMPSQGGATA